MRNTRRLRNIFLAGLNPVSNNKFYIEIFELFDSNGISECHELYEGSCHLISLEDVDI